MAGEPSGDKLGGLLAQALLKRNNQLVLSGVGSNNMETAGVNLILRSDDLAVVGILEILKNFSLIKKAMQMVVAELKKNPPDLLILIDYPGFNLRLAKRAKALGIKIMYYVSPQIWAWHYSRIHTIKKSVDRMAVLFPFEKDLYTRENVVAEFVGHPLIQNIKPSLDKTAAYAQFNLNPNLPVVALLPGSRLTEIKRLLPVMLEAIQLIRREKPGAQFILPIAPNLNLDCLLSYDLSAVTIIQNDLYNALQLANAAITASGTVTLEVAVLEIPQIIIYKLNTLTYWIAKIVTRVNSFGLCNIVAEEKIACELLQKAVTPSRIRDETLKILENKSLQDIAKQKMQKLRLRLHCENAADNAATAAFNTLSNI